jgi:hypothetical protein
MLERTSVNIQIRALDRQIFMGLRKTNFRAAASLFALLLTSCFSPTAGEKAKLNELQQVFSEIPVYKDFNQLRETNHIIKGNIAVLTAYYHSTAPYYEVKAFYSAKLAERGWIFSKEENLDGWFKHDGSRQLTFKRGEYKISVQYEGAGKSSYDYGISVVWDKNSTLPD